MSMPGVGSSSYVIPPELQGGSIPEVTYRGDTRPPDVIFAQGFQSRAPNGTVSYDSLLDYASNNTPSPYVSTSRSADVAEDFASAEDGWVYQVDTEDATSIDVNHALGSQSPYPQEQEIAIVGAIDNTDIISATDTSTGETRLNPNYTGDKALGPPVPANPPAQAEAGEGSDMDVDQPPSAGQGGSGMDVDPPPSADPGGSGMDIDPPSAGQGGSGMDIDDEKDELK